MIGVIGAELVEAFFGKKEKHVAEGLLNILRLVRLEMSSGSGCLSSAGSCQSSPPHLWSSATKWLRSQSNVLGRWWCRTLGRRRADWEGQASRIYSKCYPFFWEVQSKPCGFGSKTRFGGETWGNNSFTTVFWIVLVGI